MTWAIAALAEVATIVSGATPKTGVAEFWDGGIPWATPKDLKELSTGEIARTPRTISEAGLRSCAATVLPAGSVLFSSRAPIGHVAINSVPMATNQGFKSFVPKPGELDAKYLFHWLRAHRQQLESMGNGATFKEVSKAVVSRVEIPLPPIEEQRRIAAILDHADQLRRRFIERTDALSSLEASVFRDRFAADGASTTVADVAESTRTGPFGSQLLHGEFVDEGVAVLGLDNVVGNRFRWAQRRFITHTKYEQLKRYTVHPGDVLISIMGTVGRCVVVPVGIPIAINTKHICAVTPDQTRVLPVFLRAAFLSHPTSRAFLQQQTKGAIMDGLNMGIIRSMPLPLPSIRRQEEYVREVAAIHRERDHAEFELAGAEELVSSLQARAFSGRL